MNTLMKLGAFVLALLVVFGSAYTVGWILGPPPSAPAAAAEAEEEENLGLGVSRESNNLKVLTDSFPAGADQIFAFQILQYDGTPLMKYQPQHEKLMHLIVARQDLSNFQHVHPNLGPDGVWRVPLNLPEAGEYRIFADYKPLWGIHGDTLSANVSVSGDFQPKPLPEPSATAPVDGYEVELAGKLVVGQSNRLTLRVTKDGNPVTDLEPYLGAFGHLVVLRDGDLAYLHAHPEGTPGDGVTKPGPEVSFEVEAPSFGDYRLFLDFQHQGKVRTAEFTMHVDGPNPPPHGLTSEAFEAVKAKNETAVLNGGEASPAGGEPSPAGGGTEEGGGHGH